MRTVANNLELHQRSDWIEQESNRESVGRVFCMPTKLLEMVLPAVYQQLSNRMVSALPVEADVQITR